MPIKYNPALSPDDDFEALRLRSFTGSYNDMILAALAADGYDDGSINDALGDLTTLEWILRKGVWDDNEIWIDTEVWVD